MCGFGDSWIKGNAQQESDAFPWEPSIELLEKEQAVIIFIKNPELGKAKTRLAATLGDHAALNWYRHMLNHTRETTRLVPAKRFLYYSSFVDEGDDWDNAEFDKQLQAKGILGDRMTAAFQSAFSAGHQRVLIIGSDCLDLRVHHIKDAFQALRDHDFVIGPANDGGYYLLGMRTFQPEVFQNKEWSTESVLPDTLKDIEALGKTVHLMEELTDVDTEEDLRASLDRMPD